MTTKNDGGQAFPHGNPTHGGDAGMTLRQWYAGQALAGLCANGPFAAVRPELAQDALAYADALLAELERST